MFCRLDKVVQPFHGFAALRQVLSTLANGSARMDALQATSFSSWKANMIHNRLHQLQFLAKYEVADALAAVVEIKNFDDVLTTKYDIPLRNPFAYFADTNIGWWL